MMKDLTSLVPIPVVGVLVSLLLLLLKTLWIGVKRRRKMKLSKLINNFLTKYKKIQLKNVKMT